MNRKIIRAFFFMPAWESTPFCLPVNDTLHDTTAVTDQAHRSDSIAADSTLTTPQQYRVEEPDSMPVVQPAVDSVATSGAKASPSSIKPPASLGASHFVPDQEMVIPDYAGDYYIGKNYHLPEGNLFLLVGTEQFIVKKQLSKNIALGMAGGPSFESTLHLPYYFIYKKQGAAQDSVETALNIDYASTYYENESYNGNFANDIPFDSYNLRDEKYFWMKSSYTIDFFGIALKSLQWYLKAHLPLGTISLMIKPLAFGQHRIEQSVLFRSSYDRGEKTMLFAKEGEVMTDFQVRNYGINADAAFTRQVNPPRAEHGAS